MSKDNSVAVKYKSIDEISVVIRTVENNKNQIWQNLFGIKNNKFQKTYMEDGNKIEIEFRTIHHYYTEYGFINREPKKELYLQSLY